jgi:hypothetical protein
MAQPEPSTRPVRSRSKWDRSRRVSWGYLDNRHACSRLLSGARVERHVHDVRQEVRGENHERDD